MTTVPDAILHLSEADTSLARVISMTNTVPSFTPHTNYYQTLVDSIISQQLSVKAAATIQRRFNELFGDDSVTPSPEKIITKTVEELRAIGLSRPKAGYIQDLAHKVLNGTVHFDHLSELSNKAIVAELTQVKGIGEWTVHMFLMFCMGRLNVLPTGDLGIRNGIKKLYGFEGVPTPQEVSIIADRHNWHPYESVASWYIWQSLDNTPTIEVI